MLRLGTLQVDIDADTGGLKKAEREVKKVAGTSAAAFKKVGVAIGAAISFELARRVLLISDNMKVLERRMVRFAGSTEAADKTMQQLTKTASATGSTIESTAGIFERFSLIKDEFGATNDQILTMTDTLSKLGALGGSASEEISNSLRQLSQGLAGGVLRAEEFNSIIENTPEIAKAIGREMNLSMGELRKAMLDGKLTSDKVFRAIQSAAEQTNEEFEKMPKSITMVTQSLQNELAVAIKDLDEGLGFSDFISESIASMTEFLAEINKANAAERGHERTLKSVKELIEGATDAKAEEIEKAEELNKLSERNLFLEERIVVMSATKNKFKGELVSDIMKRELEANQKRIEQLKEESDLAQKVANIRSGAGITGDEEIAAPVVAAGPSKSDEAKLAKLRLLGETEREEILRLEEERRAFILEQEQLTEDERNALLDRVSEERLSKMIEINSREMSEEEARATARVANQKRTNKLAESQRKEAFDQEIEGLTLADQSLAALSQTKLGESRKFAALQAGVSLAINVAKATEIGFPQNLPFIAGAIAQGAQVQALLKGGGRQLGGDTSSQLAHPINEAGVPEILNQGGRQFLLPTGQGGTITPMGGGGGGGSANVTIISNGTPQTVEGTQVSREEIAIMINDSGRRTEKLINASLASGRGDTARSLQSGFKTERNLR